MTLVKMENPAECILGIQMMGLAFSYKLLYTSAVSLVRFNSRKV